MTTSIAVVHGINTDQFELLELTADVETIVDSIVDCSKTFTPIRWRSRGTVLGDVFAMRSGAWMREQVDEVKRQLFRCQADIVIGYSFGAALAHTAVTDMGLRAPVICLGSPLGHPLIGRYLALAGLRPAVPAYRQRVDIWNRDDDITSLAGLHSTLPGWKQIRIAVPKDLGIVEHFHKRYIFANGRGGPLHGATLRAMTPHILRAAGEEVH